MTTNGKKYYALVVENESGENVVGIFTSKAKAISEAKFSIENNSSWRGRLEYTLYKVSINTLNMIHYCNDYLMTIK